MATHHTAQRHPPWSNSLGAAVVIIETTQYHRFFRYWWAVDVIGRADDVEKFIENMDYVGDICKVIGSRRRNCLRPMVGITHDLI